MKLPEFHLGTRIFAPHLLPTLMTLVMLAVTISLGVWQLRRAEWKGQLIAEWQEQTQKPALDELPPADKSDTVIYRRAKLLGKYLSDKSVQLIPRAMDGHAGLELITPLKMLSGEMVLVDRGFVADDTHAAIDQPIGAVFAGGELRPIPKRGWMQPENHPENDQWFWLDPATLAAAKKINTPYPLMLVAQGKPVNSAWPAPQVIDQPYPNNHLTYAFIWFSLSFGLAVIYFLSESRKDQV